MDDLYCELLDTFRGKEEPPEGGEPHWPVATAVPMKKGADDPPDVVDMSNWALLDSHVREQLNLERDAAKMQLVLRVELKIGGLENPIRIAITNASSLSIFRRQLEARMSLAEVRAISCISMTVEQKPVFLAAKPKPPPRKGKHAASEKRLRDLSEILYGKGSAGKKQQEAEWTEECDYFMAKNPVRAEQSHLYATFSPLSHCSSRIESHMLESCVHRRYSVPTSARARSSTRHSAPKTT